MTYNNLKKLKKHLIKKKNYLQGEWVRKNSNYEEYICKILNFDLQKSRYWDAIGFNLFIEFKKGKSIWLDLIRYSEIMLEKSIDSMNETLTLFFIPNDTKNRINEIICVKTSAIINKMNLSTSQSEAILSLKEIVPRSVNCQASLTVSDVKNLATFIVKNR